MTTPILTAKPRGTVENIQALRGIAALLVVWTHLRFPILTLCPEKLYPIFATQIGAIGVDIFFVISGYVISMTAAKRHHQPLDFMAARLARVVPLYLVVTLVALMPLFNFATHRLVFQPMNFNSVWNGLFYLPVFDTTRYTPPPQYVGWTLSFEMWFYLAFALLLTVFSPKRTALVLPLIFAVGALAMMPYHGTFYLARFLFHPFVLNFSFGCIVYQLQQRLNRTLTFVILALAVVYFFVFTLPMSDALADVHYQLGDDFGLAWARVAHWGVFAALLVAGLVGLERNHLWILPKPLVWCGGISYSLYLVHQFSIWQVERLGLRLHLHSPFTICVAVFASALVLATLCHYLVERPLTTRAQALAKRFAAPGRDAGASEEV